jgi:uncharacterized membrane protein YbhN (UPF0104 family)
LKLKYSIKKFGINFVKIFITACILFYVVSKIKLPDLENVIEINKIFEATIITVIGVSLQIYVVALRLCISTNIIGYKLSQRDAWRINQIGGVLGLTPLSMIGGDIARVINLKYIIKSITGASKAIFIDRYIGFIGLLFCVLISGSQLLNLIIDDNISTGIHYIVYFSLALIITYQLLGGVIDKLKYFKNNMIFFNDIFINNYLIKKKKLTLIAFFISIFICITNIVIVYIILSIYSKEVSLQIVILAVPIIFLISMIPISVGGWGLREGAFVVIMGSLGMTPEIAVLTSVTIGVAVLISYLPGLIYLYSSKTT